MIDNIFNDASTNFCDQKLSVLKRFVRKHPSVWLLLILALLMVVGLVSNRIERRMIEKQSHEWKAYEEDLPEDGFQRDYWPNDKGHQVPYEFHSPDPRWNVLVRFFNNDEKVLAADLFIRAGTRRTSVSLVSGSYHIVYAYGGSTWYGYKRLWGRATNFGAARGTTEATGNELRTEWRGKRYEGSMWTIASEKSFGER